MATFNIGAVFSVSLTDNGFILFSGTANITVAPVNGGSPFSTYTTGTQQLGPFGTAVTVTANCITGGTYTVGGMLVQPTTSHWQTVTPSASNAVSINIDAQIGPNVLLNPPADNTQVVNAPINLGDGAEMEIDLVGGGGSGSWVAWSAGAPTVPGYVWLQGSAPTANASATNVTPIFIKRRGYKYEGTIGLTKAL